MTLKEHYDSLFIEPEQVELLSKKPAMKYMVFKSEQVRLTHIIKTHIVIDES